MLHRHNRIGGIKKKMKKVISTMIATAFALGLAASGYAQAPAGTEKKGVEQSQPTTKTEAPAVKSEAPAVKTETPGAKTEPGVAKPEKKAKKAHKKHGKKGKKSEVKSEQPQGEQPKVEEKPAK
jgi:hypothetical protein